MDQTEAQRLSVGCAARVARQFDQIAQRLHGNAYFEIIFNKRIESDGVTFTVSARASNNGEHVIVLLDPKVDQYFRNVREESHAKQEICEDWLKRNMGVPPTIDTPNGINYDFPWGHIFSTASDHIHFGHTEGFIHILYGDF